MIPIPIFRSRAAIPDPARWGLHVDASDELCLGSFPLTRVAAMYGTPVHIVDELGLVSEAQALVRAARAAYPGPVSVHFAFKCNSVPGVVALLRTAGLRAEVMSPFELDIALRAGYEGSDIVVNGPYKTEAFLARCLDVGVRFIVVDSLDELCRLNAMADATGHTSEILLRVNPDIVPPGMSSGSATGSRRGCAFGLDLRGGEVDAAFTHLGSHHQLSLAGFHAHVGTGIRDPRAYRPVVKVIAELFRRAQQAGLGPRVADIGGGFASRNSRELTTVELLRAQAFGLPAAARHSSPPLTAFLREIGDAARSAFGRDELPEIIVEPGRSVAGPHQFLLLTVHAVKERRGVGTWAITDGGLGTVTMPTYYEYHEILTCSRPLAARTVPTTILGPGCFAADIVERNKPLPPLRSGDVLALMDSGAYFTALESNFGHPRPAIAAIRGHEARLLRRRENIEDFIGRDELVPAEQEELP